MKKFLGVLLGVLLTSAAAYAAVDKAVTIGVSSESYRDVWQPVIDALDKEGIKLEFIVFSDYTLPNAALDAGEIDLDAFQHHNYLNNEIKTKGYKLTPIGDTYLVSMSVYSKNIKSLKELKKGDKIAIPGDVINTGRALMVIQGAGVIKVNPAKGNTPEVTDIIENPLGIQFVQVDAAQVPALLPDVAAGVINGGYAHDFGLSPKRDAIFYDDLAFYKDKGYVNLIAARTADKDNPVYKRVVEAFHSDAQRKYILEKFDGAYLPVW
ncbi:MAG: MetQ/NlpA family ABC transporter substrate-binding protein [Synergistaceae bacterium]|nr:MetQ/NlpA family ABC transporter substrate-binding protein [Synergistaceae bacterium]